MPGITIYGPTGQPLAPAVPAVVEPTFQALRVVQKPYDYAYPGTVLGHYRAIALSTAAAFTANVNLLDFFFSPATPVPNAVAVLGRLRAHVYVATAVTAQRTDPLVAFAARGYTVQAATGATAVTLTGNNAKARTGMGGAIAKIGVASAAGGITGGTRTLDAAGFGLLPLSNTSAIAGLGTGSNGVLDLYENFDTGQHPMTFGGQAGPEGFVVQWGTTTLATGTVVVGFEVEWAETILF